MKEIKWHTCTLAYHSGRQIWEVTCTDHNVSTLINVMLQILCQINNGFPLKKVWSAVNWATAQQVRTEDWRILTWQIDSKIKTCKNICFTCLLRDKLYFNNSAINNYALMNLDFCYVSMFIYLFYLFIVVFCRVPVFQVYLYNNSLLSRFVSITTHRSSVTTIGSHCFIAPTWNMMKDFVIPSMYILMHMLKDVMGWTSPDFSSNVIYVSTHLVWCL